VVISVDDVLEGLLPVLRKHLRFIDHKHEFPLETNLIELGLDSMSAVNLLLDIEMTFDLTFPDAMLTAETFRTASTLVRAIQSLS